MAEGKAEISIDKSPDEVWKLVREFGGLETWMPGIETCVVDGDTRAVGLMGIEVKEQLRSLDDSGRRISYSIVESPIDNLESHLATIAVDPEGSGSHVTWTVAVDPDDLLGLFVPMYEGSVAALKTKLEG